MRGTSQRDMQKKQVVDLDVLRQAVVKNVYSVCTVILKPIDDTLKSKCFRLLGPVKMAQRQNKFTVIAPQHDSSY